MKRTRLISGGLAVLAACMLAQGQDLQTRIHAVRQRALNQALPAQQSRVKVGLELKPHPADRIAPDCVEVVAVLPGYPAAQAGIKPGDLILAVDGSPVPSPQAFISATGHPGTVTLEVTRSGRPVKLRLALPESGSLGPFTVPNLERPAPGATGINTLREVFVDPRTGNLVFLGTDDPAYATGPIDYATLLADAQRSPYPAFSLDPSPATRATREALLRKVDADMAQVQRDMAYGKAWMLRIGTLLLSDPALELDRQRFLKKGAEAMGSTPGHVRAFWDLASGRMQGLSPEGVDMVAALFVKMGTPDVGQALQAMKNNNAAAGIELLGLGPLLADTRQKMQAGAISQEYASTLLQAAFWEQVMRRLKVPEAAWRRHVDRAKAGSEPLGTFLPVVENLLSGSITDHVMLPWLNGLVLSQAFLERFYQVPPVEVVPSFRSGLAPDSELARTFFAADWCLKMLAISPEMSERVPGHVTYQNYAFGLASSRGVYAPGSRGAIRAWLTPQAVQLRQDPSGTVLAFGPSKVAIRSELTTFEGGSRAADALERQAADGYAQEVTRRYDDYARALPDLHRLREAAKVIALARWAKQRNQVLVPPGPAAPARPLPASFRQGFWTATFEADANKILFVISAHGGVDFDSKAGEAWAQPQTEPGLAGSALKQLVGSAALAQQAAGAALKGDLEGARELAQKSEQAMIGDLRSGFPPLAQIPEVPEPTAFAAFQSQALAQSQEAITGLKQATSETERQPWKQKLQNLQELMAQGQQNPALAPKLSVQLRQGPMGSTYLAPVTSPQAVIAPGPSAPPVTLPVPSGRPPLPQAPVARPQPASPPAPAALPASRPTMSPEERARILNEIGQLRGELCRIQTQLRKFSATVQSDQTQRAEWEQVTNAAYDRALDEVKDAISNELKDLSMDLPNGYLEDKLAKAGTQEERERIQRALRLVQHLKESYELKDFSVWASYEDYSRDEIIEGAKMVAELTGLDEWIKNKLVKRWGLGRVIAFGEAAQDIVASAYDVTSEVLAWKRLNQLNRNSDAFLKAVEATRKRMQAVMEGIHARELKLGLPPGATQGGCP